MQYRVVVGAPRGNIWKALTKVVIWLKNRKCQIIVKREIIEASGGFYLARLSSKQYGRLDGRLVLKLCCNDNPNYIGDISNTERYKANRAISFRP